MRLHTSIVKTVRGFAGKARFPDGPLPINLLKLVIIPASPLTKARDKVLHIVLEILADRMH